MSRPIDLKTHSLIIITKYLNDFVRYCNNIGDDFRHKFPKGQDKIKDNLSHVASYKEEYFLEYEGNVLKTIENFERFLQRDTDEEKKEMRILLNLSAEYKQFLTKTIDLFDKLPDSKSEISKNISRLNDLHHEIHITSRLFIHKLTREGIAY